MGRCACSLERSRIQNCFYWHHKLGGEIISKLRKSILIFAIAFLYALICAEAAKIEIKEDFLGNGEFSSYTNYGKAEDRAFSREGDFAYGRSLSIQKENCSLFSGFEADIGSYKVASPEHHLQVSKAKNLSVTATIEALGFVEADGFSINGSGSSYSMFCAQGEGMVREIVLTAGPKGRPVDLTSMYHAGMFQINSSARFIS